MKHAFRVAVVATMGLLFSFTPTFAQVNTVSLSKSTVTPLQQSVVADGQQELTVEVYVRNELSAPLPNIMVDLEASQAGSVRVTPPHQTDENGKAVFMLKSTIEGLYHVYVLADGNVLIPQPAIYFTAPSCSSAPGRLIKLPDDQDPSTQIDSTVYYYGKDCKRHAFSNQKVYDTWYANFDSVQIVSATELAAMSLGKNVTYRPGIKLVKFVTAPATYAVAQGGVLRRVTEETATGLYGSAWNTKVDDISDAFYSNYTFGADVLTVATYSTQNEQTKAATIDASF